MTNKPASIAQQKGVGPEQWVEHYGDDLFRFAYKRVRDRQCAEEMVQETFLAAARAQNQYRGSGSERGWLLRILQYKIIDMMRARARIAGPRFADSAADAEDDSLQTQFFDPQGRWKTDQWPHHQSRTLSGEQQAEFHELWHIVQRCLTRIPQRQADVFVLSVIDELESKTICEILGITAQCLWGRLHRARLGLAKCVGSKWFASEEWNMAHE